MTIGSTFPARRARRTAPVVRRLTIAEIAEIVSPAKGQRSDADARKIVVAHTGKPEPKENGDEG